MRAIKPKRELEDTSTLEYILKHPHMPVFGMGVSREFLQERCLKPGDKCRRFHSVSLSDGEIQAVMCKWGPYRKCEKSMGEV